MKYAGTFRLASVGAVLLCALAMSVGGAAAQPTSRSEALEQGDPAATAPSFSEAADGYVYNGKRVSAAMITDKRLSCLAVDRGPSRCYDDAAALQAAEVRPTATASARPRPRAHMTACGVYELLFIWTGADYAGASAAFEDHHRWANLGAAINNEGSSFHMGDASGHLADLPGGGGYWYPRDTSACAHENNLNRNGSGWNNRISSRYRN